MTHPVYPVFPTVPTPIVGDTFTPAGTTQDWTFLGESIGWVKTKIQLNHTDPSWPGRISSTAS